MPRFGKVAGDLLVDLRTREMVDSECREIMMMTTVMIMMMIKKCGWY